MPLPAPNWNLVRAVILFYLCSGSETLCHCPLQIWNLVRAVILFYLCSASETLCHCTPQIGTWCERLYYFICILRRRRCAIACPKCWNLVRAVIKFNSTNLQNLSHTHIPPNAQTIAFLVHLPKLGVKPYFSLNALIKWETLS